MQTVTMAIFNKFVFVFVLCLIQNITCEFADLGEIQEKITELVGEKQNNLMQYLNYVKGIVDEREYELSNAVWEAKRDIPAEIDEIVQKITPDLSGINADQPCAVDLLAKIEEINYQKEEIIKKCVTSEKPSLVNLFDAITKHAEFRTKIGKVPSICIQTNDDVESVLNCIKNALNVIQVEMDDSKKIVDYQINITNLDIDGFLNELLECSGKNLEKQKSKAKEAKTIFDNCVNDQ